MFRRLAHFAKRIWDLLSSATNQFFRRVTQPALAKLFTGSLADLPRSRAQLLTNACAPSSATLRD